jgi:hypothetical protein
VAAGRSESSAVCTAQSGSRSLALLLLPLPAAPACCHTSAARPSLPGISLKTQELYLLVFITRYLDLFTNFVSL